ncbi:MAG: hypothetical protein WA982_04025 [Rubrobacteraceae bacterium]
MSSAVALGILLLIAGSGGLIFGTYALLRGGRGQRGGIGPIPERGIHLVAGIRMLLIGTLSFATGVYVLWSF